MKTRYHKNTEDHFSKNVNKASAAEQKSPLQARLKKFKYSCFRFLYNISTSQSKKMIADHVVAQN